MRQIVLDTETTGLDPSQGHRIIEIGCVEIENRRLTGRHFHCYLNPDREIDEGAVQVHGITSAFLADKPRFPQVSEDFLRFVKGAELIIHNAPFDMGFLNSEFALTGNKVPLESHCSVVDTLVMARKKHPGQRNSLDALCKRYEVDNSQRELHGALLDAEILADVYLLMTGGQTWLQLGSDDASSQEQQEAVVRKLDISRGLLQISLVTAQEEEAHERFLLRINKSSGGRCVWMTTESES